MTQELLTDMYYAAPELWFGLAVVFSALLGICGYYWYNYLKLKQSNYFLNRDRERYAETLYASKDGYFAFIYPDEKIEDPRKNVMEHCSRRLSVMMNLPDGTNSGFDEILKNFYKEDAKKILKYIDLLREDGVSFEDEFTLRSGKHLRLSGSRINGADGSIYCDMVWFRDVSVESQTIDELESQKNNWFKQILKLEDLINNIPYPVWLRDDKLNIFEINKKYLDFFENQNRDDILQNHQEIQNVNGDNISRNLAFLAHSVNKTKKQAVSIIKNGERRIFEVIETPFHVEESLDKIYTAGALIDITELDDLKRNLKIHQNAHLEIMGMLGTAFAVFDSAMKLAFYNKAFVQLWKLEDIWLEQQPNYSMFLDILREKRMLPEVPDYLAYKNGEQKDFSLIIEAKEDMLHLPSGQTIRRVRIPHPADGLVFAYEDVSDKLATRRAYNSLLAIQKESLENLFDAVIIFGFDGHLNFYNQSYVSLWKTEEHILEKEPNISELIETQKGFFTKVDDWKGLKADIINHIISFTTKTFILNRDDIDKVEVMSRTLSDGSIMVTYKRL